MDNNKSSKKKIWIIIGAVLAALAVAGVVGVVIALNMEEDFPASEDCFITADGEKRFYYC